MRQIIERVRAQVEAAVGWRHSSRTPMALPTPPEGERTPEA
jgi:hypothetical protein